MLLAIDPGKDTGWAIVRDGKLFACGLGDARTLAGTRPFTKLVIERPQVYRGRTSKGDPNDLITLAIQVGRYLQAFAATGLEGEEIIPHTWKGTVDPDVLCRRVYASLDDAERAVLLPVLEPLARKSVAEDLTGGRRHNVIDAVGLAKWSLKRVRAAVF